MSLELDNEINALTFSESNFVFSNETWSKCHILTSVFDNYHFQLIKITNIISGLGQLKQVWATEN